MAKKSKLNMSPEELVALASSLSITISKNFEFEDICALRIFFSTVAGNLGLIEYQTRNFYKDDKK